ncbi:MAG: glycogen debranching protein GlgX [Gammaproteobacteria bacterium]
MNTAYKIQSGFRYPAGATPVAGGVNFSIYSQHAAQAELLLFEGPRSLQPFQIIPLEPRGHRTFFFWHVLVVDLPVGTYYAWRMDGPDDPASSGLRFDREKVLLDPWARAVSDALWNRKRASEPGDNLETSMRGVVVADVYDWEDDEPLGCHDPEKAVIYELHVDSFTRHAGSGVRHPGTFLGLIEKIPYIKALGVTHVELMPVMAFDRQDVPPGPEALGLGNYWGYSTHSFFSPHPGYCVAEDAVVHRDDFRDLVKSLHEVGIGVILDVVFNHTAEGGIGGPTINFKGIGNDTFYHLDPMDRRNYRDYTGVGNTFNCNHPLAARFIVECLEYWVREMHVDGFRFDLASVLSRGEDGQPLYHAPVLWNIEFSEALSDTRIIAEAWDAAGLYQVGDFPGFRWAEWNGHYRDVIRRYVRGDKGLVSELAMRLSGNSDLYQSQDRSPMNSINFVTCHDGFTLQDLVSYNRKHNEANGEDNRDGSNNECSWNCGHEGETGQAAIHELRHRQTRNFIAILMLSQGVPMLLAGDEVRRTQQGNNNPWCQNNAISWFDWNLPEANHDMLRFTRLMIAFRRRHACLMHRRFLTGQARDGFRFPDVSWHGISLHKPLWDHDDAQVLAFTLGRVRPSDEDLHIILNMGKPDLEMPLPENPGHQWCRAVDTACDSPQDILEPSMQVTQSDLVYVVRSRSVVVFESRKKEPE